MVQCVLSAFELSYAAASPKGTIKLASVLQGKSKGVTLLCTTSNHLISTELKSTDKLATILSPTDIDEMVDLYLGDGGIDDVVQFLQDTSKAAILRLLVPRWISTLPL